ncbi:MAG: hypothetical protein SRB1_02582 [Desulfobacteraceae bacterium Eth-SRB1]|nr:MAG: hypothetical protein SRB1_02582 [Desulfobacteraceae bacterium Eth-SRB1]
MKNKKAGREVSSRFSRGVGKRGWMLIMEATIAMIIISGALIAVYSQQTDRGVDPVEYYDSLQGQILADVSGRSDLRLNVLNVEEEDFGDGNFTALNDFIGGKIPEGFGYSIRVCRLGDDADHCNMRAPVFIATMDEDIYVEEIIVSAEVGEGTDAIYNPKKLRLFVWEGKSVDMDCENNCSVEGMIFSCSEDRTQVLEGECVGSDDSFCLEWEEGDTEVIETCEDGYECVDGLGICGEVSNTFNLTCEKEEPTYMGCVDDDDDATVCAGGRRQETGGCDPGLFGYNGDYTTCWYMVEEIVECSENPECPSSEWTIKKKERKTKGDGVEFRRFFFHCLGNLWDIP